MTITMTLSELLNGRGIAAHAELGSAVVESIGYYGRSKKTGRVVAAGMNRQLGEFIPCELAHCASPKVLGDWAYKAGPRSGWQTAATRGEAIRALDECSPRVAYLPRLGRIKCRSRKLLCCAL